MQPAPVQMPAACALHPSQLASGVCSRCGSFVCERCLDHGAFTTCPSCRERTGEGLSFPLSRDSWTVGDLLSHAWAAFAANWLMLSLAALLIMVSGWIMSFSTELLVAVLMAESRVAGAVASLASAIAQNAVQLPLTLGLMCMAHAALMGRRAEPGELLRHFNKIPKLIALSLLFLAPGVFVGFLAFSSPAPGALAAFAIVFVATLPIVWLWLAFYFAQMEIALNDEVGVTDAIKNAMVICKGKRLAICGVFLLAGLIGAAGLLALCVGVVASAAFALVTSVGLYLTLRNGTGLPEHRRRRQVS
ncbi:MAG: hypothetical protein ACOX6T_07980 [Myxococcales bacterium]|jgi:hypothetical protein